MPDWDQGSGDHRVPFLISSVTLSDPLSSDREFHGTKSSNNPQLLHSLTSVLWKMSLSPRLTVTMRSPVLCIVEGSIQWGNLPSHLAQVGLCFSEFVSTNPTPPSLYLVRQLGAGSEGSCFLGCDDCGKVCVVKMFRVNLNILPSDLKILNEVFI